MEQNIDNHQLYLDAYKDFMTFFTASKEQLQSNSSHTGELDELESRLKAVKVPTFKKPFPKLFSISNVYSVSFCRIATASNK